MSEKSKLGKQEQERPKEGGVNVGGFTEGVSESGLSSSSTSLSTRRAGLGVFSRPATGRSQKMNLAPEGDRETTTSLSFAEGGEDYGPSWIKVVLGATDKALKYGSVVVGKVKPGWGSVVGFIVFGFRFATQKFNNSKKRNAIKVVDLEAGSMQKKGLQGEFIVEVTPATDNYLTQLGVESESCRSKGGRLAVGLSVLTIALQLSANYCESAVSMGWSGKDRERLLLILSLMFSIFVMCLEDQRKAIERNNQSREMKKVEWRRNTLDVLVHLPSREEKQQFVKHMRAILADKKERKKDSQQTHPRLHDAPVDATIEEREALTAESIERKGSQSSTRESTSFGRPAPGKFSSSLFTTASSAQGSSHHPEQELAVRDDDTEPQKTTLDEVTSAVSKK